MEAPKPQRVRRRKWGSTVSTAKKSTINISTDSLKGIIDIQPEAISRTEPVLDLATGPELGEEEVETGADDAMDTNTKPAKNKAKDNDEDEPFKIRRTVTQDVKPADDSSAPQVAPLEPQEDERHVELELGKEDDDDLDSDKPKKEEKKKDKAAKVIRRVISRQQQEAAEAAARTAVTPPSSARESRDSPTRHSKPDAIASALPTDEPEAPKRAPSPARNPASNVVHLRHLVRPFTVGQLKELLGRTGKISENGFWIDKIKSHSIVAFETEDQGIATRQALHGTRWPSSNPKHLRVEYASMEEMDYYRNGKEGAFQQQQPPAIPAVTRKPEVDKAQNEAREALRAEREAAREARLKEREEKERARKREEHVREWDRHKIRQSASRSRSREQRERRKSSGDRGRDERRDRSREERRDRDKERRERKERKAKEEEPPAKLLDDLFRKTKATPCIYWLPLTEEQSIQHQKDKKVRLQEMEKRRLERLKEEEEEQRQREREREERRKMREREMRERRSERSRSRGKRRP